jgi:cobaltochelatase CobN
VPADCSLEHGSLEQGAMNDRPDKPVTSGRGAVLGQILICDGCCCGRVERDYPAVPRDWLKAQWKARKLNRHVQLTISGCLGPCDVANVVAILTRDGCTWLGELNCQDQYAELLAWASAAAETGVLPPLPAALERHLFSRFEPPIAAPLAASGRAGG